MQEETTHDSVVSRDIHCSMASAHMDDVLVTPEVVGFGFPQTQFGNAFMANQVGGYGFQHAVLLGIMPRLSMVTPQFQLVRPNPLYVIQAGSGHPTTGQPNPNIMQMFRYNEYPRSNDSNLNHVFK